MDPDEASMAAADAQAGGDNLLSNRVAVATTATTHPSTAQTNSAQDKNDITLPHHELGSSESETVNANNSNARADITPDPSPSQSSVQAELQLRGSGRPETETVDEAVEDLGPRETSDNIRGTSPDVPPAPMEESSGKDVEDGVVEEETADGEGEGQREKEEDVEVKRDEDEEQDQASDRDESKQSSGQDEASEDPINLKRRQRASLYKEGLKLQETPGNVEKALGCFLGAITGLTEVEAFPELPQCLHEISNIYFEKNEYEKAVHFIQAEKMYYETALIDIVNVQKQLESTSEDKGEEATDEKAQKTLLPEESDSPEIVKAKEYEDLAKLCLKESKPHLALDYCGKATKLYREVYGDNHPTTIGSLDLFTMIYADVGKKLYADAMQKFDAEEKDTEASAEQSQIGSDKIATAGEETTSELRQRSKIDPQQPGSQASSGEPSTQASSAEPSTQARMELEPAPHPDEHDDWLTTCLLMVLFFLITALVLLLMSYFYCLSNERSPVCHQFKGDLSYWYMKIKHDYFGF